MRSASVGLAVADTETYALANNAIQACVSRFEFDQVHVFTDRTEFWPQYQCTRIPTIQNIEDYNRVMLEQLPQVTREDFCIVVQYDGFILNRDGFSPDFYNFDYIGAVWPQYPYLRVGNGGFSWRSRRLVDAVASLAHLRAPGEAEDVFTCRSLRIMLEDRFGCRFADEETARRFSYEISPMSVPPFGFHGSFNLPLVYRDNLAFLISNLPQRVLRSKLGQLRFGASQLSALQQAEFQRLIDTALAQ